MYKQLLSASAVCLSFINAVQAHDMWLVPPSSPMAAGGKAEVIVSVGMDFPISLNSANPERLSVSASNGNVSSKSVIVAPDEANKQTKASFVVDEPGTWLVCCTTKPNRIELKAKAFNDYLLHDGLPQILAQRLDADELDRDAKEQYSKYTKTVFSVNGIGEGNTAAKVVGQTLEIVFLENPLNKKPGDTLSAQVLFRGEPLTKANLCWDHPGNGEAFSGQTLTGEDGRAIIPIAASGLMTVRLVHMTRPKTDEYEWESFWSSFTFCIPKN